MPLTKEQLLQKRFKFILPFPGAHWRIGGIFELVGDDLYAVSGLPIKMLGCILEEYPHIFQPLPWYSDRKPEDMPEYLKWRTKQQIVKPVRWEANCEFYYLSEHDIVGYYSDYTDPATEEEYNAYINQKQQ